MGVRSFIMVLYVFCIAFLAGLLQSWEREGHSPSQPLFLWGKWAALPPTCPTKILISGAVGPRTPTEIDFATALVFLGRRVKNTRHEVKYTACASPTIKDERLSNLSSLIFNLN